MPKLRKKLVTLTALSALCLLSACQYTHPWKASRDSQAAPDYPGRPNSWSFNSPAMSGANPELFESTAPQTMPVPAPGYTAITPSEPSTALMSPGYVPALPWYYYRNDFRAGTDAGYQGPVFETEFNYTHDSQGISGDSVYDSYYNSTYRTRASVRVR